MFRRKPDLIVPVRDRRQHKRYLTLRNARNVGLVLAVVFLAISIRSEMQPRQSEGFGRLFERELSPVETKPMEVREVVKEATPPIDDQTAADPMLVAPAAREQWLHDITATTSAAIEPVVSPRTPRLGESNITIVGGPEGVRLTTERRRRQVLSGGFGR